MHSSCDRTANRRPWLLSLLTPFAPQGNRAAAHRRAARRLRALHAGRRGAVPGRAPVPWLRRQEEPAGALGRNREGRRLGRARRRQLRPSPHRQASKPTPPSAPACSSGAASAPAISTRCWNGRASRAGPTPRRIAAAGWSHGGWTVLDAMALQPGAEAEKSHAPLRPAATNRSTASSAPSSSTRGKASARSRPAAACASTCRSRRIVGTADSVVGGRSVARTLTAMKTPARADQCRNVRRRHARLRRDRGAGLAREIQPRADGARAADVCGVFEEVVGRAEIDRLAANPSARRTATAPVSSRRLSRSRIGSSALFGAAPKA